MKKVFTFLLLLLFAVSILIPGAHTASAAKVERYGYTQLANDRQRTAYNAIAKGVEDVQAQICFEINGITQNNINDVLEDIKRGCEMVTKDFPELFWFDGAVSISVDGSRISVTPAGYSVNGKRISNKNDLRPYQNQLDKAVEKVMSKIKGNYSDYEIAHTFHDYLVENVYYVAQGDHQTAYGALVGGKAVCAGYARAYQLLMHTAGIRCFYISGESYDPTGQRVAHAWNLVWLDGLCYYSDVTWDDQSNDLFHEYLNLSKEEISKTHFTNDPLPKSCGHDNYTFFVKNDGKGVCDFHGHRNMKEVAGCFELKSMNGETATYYCTIHYHGDNFRQWFDRNKVAIISELGLMGTVQCQIIELGLEHHVTLTGKSGSQNTRPTDPPAQQETQPPTQPPTQAPTQPPTQAPTQSVKPDPTPTQGNVTTPTQPQQQATVPATGDIASTTPEDTGNPTQGTDITTDPDGSESGSVDTTQDVTTPSSTDDKKDDKDPSIVSIVGYSALAVAAASGIILAILRKRNG